MMDTSWVQQFQQRTKRFALSCIRISQQLPRSSEAQVIGKQLLRAGTSVGANYRAACRAKSKADFIYKLGICVEEADEACYWMELLIEAQLVREEEILPHKTEAQEILSIISKSRATAKKNLKN